MKDICLDMSVHDRGWELCYSCSRSAIILQSQCEWTTLRSRKQFANGYSTQDQRPLFQLRRAPICSCWTSASLPSSRQGSGTIPTRQVNQRYPPTFLQNTSGSSKNSRHHDIHRALIACRVGPYYPRARLAPVASCRAHTIFSWCIVLSCPPLSDPHVFAFLSSVFTAITETLHAPLSPPTMD